MRTCPDHEVDVQGRGTQESCVPSRSSSLVRDRGEEVQDERACDGAVLLEVGVPCSGDHVQPGAGDLVASPRCPRTSPPRPYASGVVRKSCRTKALPFGKGYSHRPRVTNPAPDIAEVSVAAKRVARGELLPSGQERHELVPEGFKQARWQCGRGCPSRSLSVENSIITWTRARSDAHPMSRAPAAGLV